MDVGDCTTVRVVEESLAVPEKSGKCVVQCTGKPTYSTIVSNLPDDTLLDDSFLNNNSDEQQTTTEQVPCSPNTNYDHDYSLRSLDLVVLQPMKVPVNSELDFLNDDDPDNNYFFIDDVLYDSDKDPEFVPDSESEASIIIDVPQEDLPDLQTNDNPIENRVGLDDKQLTRKRVRNEDNWARNIKKQKVNSGAAYVSRLGKNHDKKVLGMSCTDKCILKCNEKFTNVCRKEIFDKFYNMSDITRKRDYISKLISMSDNNDGRSPTARKCNALFYLEVGGKRERVCKVMFKSTFAISNNFISTVLKKCDNNGFTGEEARGKHGKQKKTDEKLINSVIQHINSFPRIESHYCRARTKKEYLEGGLNLSMMYRMYEEENKGKSYVKKHLYESIFNTKFNISFFKPKKDLCVKCEEYKLLSDEEKIEKEDQQKMHREEVSLSRLEKEKDKEKSANDEDLMLAVYDLEAVFQLPQGKASLFYYKSKLNAYNFTVADISKKDTSKRKGYCYLWHEGIATRGGVEIASCVYEFIKDHCKEKKKLIFYSDNTVSQNKNRYIFAMYLFCIQTMQIESITHKYLIVGHTENEADSIHSCIEREKQRILKSGPIFIPSEISMLVKTSKKTGEPYNVKEMETSDFYDWKKLSEDIGNNFSLNTDDEKCTWNDVKIVEVRKQNPNSLFYKTSYKSECFKEIFIKRKSRKILKELILKKAYTEGPSISDNKRKDLVSLCSANLIPKAHHPFFLNLKSTKKVTPKRPTNESSDEEK